MTIEDHNHNYNDNMFAVSLKDYIIQVLREREEKYNIRFESIESNIFNISNTTKDAFMNIESNTKDALQISTQTVKEALGTANNNMNTLMVSLDKRFDSVNEFRKTLSDQQDLFARKLDLETALSWFEKSVLKAEQAANDRFSSVNEFRATLSDQQRNLVTKNEVDIRFKSLDDKLDTAVAALQLNEGKSLGSSMIWAAIGLITLIFLTAGSLILQVFPRIAAH